MNTPEQNPHIWLEVPDPGQDQELFEVIDANRGPLSKFWWERETQSVDDSRQFIERTLADERGLNALSRMIMTHDVEVDRDRIVGVGGIHSIDMDKKTGQLGMWVDQAEAGRGIGTAAEKLLVRLAFEELGLDEVRISTRESNSASRRIAEKVGFTLLTIDHQPTWKTDEYLNVAQYAITRAQYADLAADGQAA
jgi:ribosomal-protein-serine acetyltransferase